MSGLQTRIAESFARQGLMQHLGAQLLEVADGRVVFALPMSERVTQQQGAFHGGAISALADICCGYAALTQAPQGMEVTSVEFKINFVRAALGERLRCVGEVVKAGRTLAVTRAEVFDESGPDAKTCAVMQATMIYVAKTY
jgi:uncharacterized protein (TIGR00369 family)